MELAVSKRKYLNGMDWAGGSQGRELHCTASLRSINHQGFYSTQFTLFVKGFLRGRLR